ncbi:MAG: prolipoprotein diacylglyceryl transferase [Chloroflexi bacterium]|nr:prolipoprotein diacylglyceryl transferase [Chloroflexota bacterium]
MTTFAIPIPFEPTAVQLGPLVLAWHGIFTALGVLAGIWLAARLAPRAGIAEDVVWNAAWWIVLGGIAGARLLFAVEHPALFVREPWRLVLLNEGGISVFGAVLGGIAAGAVWAMRAGIAPPRLLDAVAPGFLLGQAIGRIGDVINGEHLGVHAPSLPWAVVYTHPDTLGELGVPVHPAVAYELLWDLGAAGVVIWLLGRWQLPPGVALWTGLFLYGLGRFWVGFYRMDQDVAFGLGLAQLIGLAALPVALAGVAWALQARRAQQLPAGTPT